MSYYDVMQVCIKGHQITARYNKSPQLRQDHCKNCGSPTMIACRKCKEPIRGKYHVPGVASMLEVQVPDFCHKCGAAYPWTKTNPEKEDVVDKEQNDFLQNIVLICDRFHTIAKQIQKRYDNRSTLEIKDEYDVQNLLHALLKMFFDDIRPEEYTPSTAGASARMDFLLKGHNTVIEVKMTRKGLGDKEISKQLVLDIEWYRKHEHCRTLVCFIYDPDGIIANPKGIIDDVGRETDDLSVLVLIKP